MKFIICKSCEVSFSEDDDWMLIYHRGLEESMLFERGGKGGWTLKSEHFGLPEGCEFETPSNKRDAGGPH